MFNLEQRLSSEQKKTEGWILHALNGSYVGALCSTLHRKSTAFEYTNGSMRFGAQILTWRLKLGSPLNTVQLLLLPFVQVRPTI